MTKSKKRLALVCAAFAAAILVTGIIFHTLVVGGLGTNLCSVLFGWQWIYLGIASFAVLCGALTKSRRRFLVAALIVLSSLAAVLVPARLVESSHTYITGDGGPAGPRFSCLVWKNPNVGGAYGDRLSLCTLMSIPSYNKFLIDRSRDADQRDSSATYYAMLVLNEAVIVGGLWFAYRYVQKRKPRTD